MNSLPNERVYLKIYDYETKEFSGLTTYHGLVRIYNSNTWPSRIFWTVVVLSCLSLFMIHSGLLLLGYHGKPTLFQINSIVPEEGIIFPGVTICNHFPINLAKTRERNISDSVVSYILHSYADLDEIKELDDRYQEEYMEFTEKSGKRFKMTNFMKAFGWTCEEMIDQCAFGGNMVENCCDVARLELTDAGLCVRFPNDDQKFRQVFSGNGYGWRFVMKNIDQDTETLTLPSQFSSQGFRIGVQEQGKIVSMMSQSSSVAPGFHIHESLQIRNISLLGRNDWGTCMRSWDVPLHGERILELNYTMWNCEQNCEALEMLKLCDCLPIYLSNLSVEDSPVCTPDELVKCGFQNQDFNCTCDNECDLLEIDTDISFTRMRRRARKDDAHEISIASIYLRSVSYERHEQQKQMQVADLLANIAGSMGLFLGMSTVTLLEIFIYLFKSVWGTVNSTRQKQFLEAVEEEERVRNESFVILDDEQLDEDLTRTRRQSTNPIHIHLDRRNSRMILGGDLFSGPRDSIAIPSQLLSPLSQHRHRRSISVANMLQRSLTHPEEVDSPPKKKKVLKRSSTVAAADNFADDSFDADTILLPTDLRRTNTRKSSNPFFTSLL